MTDTSALLTGARAVATGFAGRLPAIADDVSPRDNACAAAIAIAIAADQQLREQLTALDDELQHNLALYAAQLAAGQDGGTAERAITHQAEIRDAVTVLLDTLAAWVEANSEWRYESSKLCYVHKTARGWRYGKPRPRHAINDVAAQERFWNKVQKGGDGECWMWYGALMSTGYGTFGVAHNNQLAHRVAYELTIGPIADGLTLDHLCRNRRCVNPAHLEPVTLGENSRRAAASRKAGLQ